jgi:hypothetical protein
MCSLPIGRVGEGQVKNNTIKPIPEQKSKE